MSKKITAKEIVMIKNFFFFLGRTTRMGGEK